MGMKFLTKLVTIAYSDKEEKARAVEQFHLFGSTEGVVIRNIISYMGNKFFQVMGVFRRRKK